MVPLTDVYCLEVGSSASAAALIPARKGADAVAASVANCSKNGRLQRDFDRVAVELQSRSRHVFARTDTVVWMRNEVPSTDLT